MKRIFLLISLILQVGCATTVSLSPEDKSRIRTVSIQQADIEIPVEIYYHGPGQAMLGTLGAVGAVAGQAAAEEPKARLQELVSRENISIAAILQRAFKQRLGESGAFKVVDNNADAKMKIKVTRYGLRISEPFAFTVKPWISAQVVLLDSADKVVFQNILMPEIMTADDFPQVYTLREYLEKPELLRGGFERGAANLADKLIDGLK